MVGSSSFYLLSSGHLLPYMLGLSSTIYARIIFYHIWSDQIIHEVLLAFTIYGRIKVSTLYGQTKVSTLYGQTKASTLYGRIKVSTLYGQTKASTLYGQTKVSTLYGQTKVFTLYVQTKVSTLYSQTKVWPGQTIFYLVWSDHLLPCTFRPSFTLYGQTIFYLVWSDHLLPCMVRLSFTFYGQTPDNVASPPHTTLSCLNKCNLDFLLNLFLHLEVT